MALIQRIQKHLLNTTSSFTIMTWNILSDQLAYNFPEVNPEHLKWPYRQKLIYQEILRINADIILLQELDHYEDMHKELKIKGYSSIFQQKKGWHDDGVAIFFREKMFELKQKYSILLSGSQVALGMKLKKDSQEFYVFTTHLKSFKGFDNERAQQVRVLLSYIEGLEKLPIVIGGDFNSEPGSCAYEEINKGSWNLKSVYCFGKEAEFTTVKFRDELEVKTEDYLWQNGFEVVAYLGIPYLKDIDKGGLPCWNYPSDHFALAADLRFSSSE